MSLITIKEVPAPQLVVVKEEPVAEPLLKESDSVIEEELGHAAVKEELLTIDKHEIVLKEEKLEVPLIQKGISVKCPECGVKRANLKNHIRFVHRKIFSAPCKHCPYKGKTPWQLKIHINRLHAAPEKIQWFNCKFCDYKCKERNNLKGHFRNRHVSEEKTRIFKCTKCDYSAKVIRRLKLHIAAVHSDLIKCETCGSQYRRGNTHFLYCRYFNKGTKVFECDSCHYRTKTLALFKNHLKFKHTDPEKQMWHYCEFCPFKTLRKESLKKHIVTKHDEEPDLYVCEFCPYGVSYKKLLITHIRKEHS